MATPPERRGRPLRGGVSRWLRGEEAGEDHKRDQRFEEQRTLGLLNVVVAVAVAAVGYTDWMVVANVSLGYLYVLPIALSGLINPLPITAALAVVCMVLQDIFGPPADSLQLRIVHNVIGVAGFLIVAFLVTLIAKQRDRLAAQVRRQRDAYEHDLILAAQVQRRVLPKPPTLRRFRVRRGDASGAAAGRRLLRFFPDIRGCGGCGDCRCFRQGRGGRPADAFARAGAAHSRAGAERTRRDRQRSRRSVEADYQFSDIRHHLLCAFACGQPNAGVHEWRA